MNALLIANECEDTRIRGQTPRILCKLDVEKAYDHVNWGFHDKVPEDMGFGRKWIKWTICLC